MGTWGVLTNIYFKGLFFIYRSSLSGLHFYTSGESQAGGGGGGVKANLIIFCQGGGVFKTNLNKTIFFLSITSILNIHFS